MQKTTLQKAIRVRNRVESGLIEPNPLLELATANGVTIVNDGVCVWAADAEELDEALSKPWRSSIFNHYEAYAELCALVSPLDPYSESVLMTCQALRIDPTALYS